MISSRVLGADSGQSCEAVIALGYLFSRYTLLNSSIQAYEKLSALLQQFNILTDAAEIHGILCGMLSGGMPLESRDWLEPLADFVNQGEPFSSEVKTAVLELYDETCQQLVDSEFALVLCLPDDAAPINERGQALISWIQGYLVGFGLHQADLTGCSEEAKEALQDFSEIARMDEQMNDDEESEQALFEVMEYVRVSAMLCFNELGKSAAVQQEDSKTVH